MTAVLQVNVIIDSIITGNTVGADAISAINLAAPIVWMTGLVSSMISVGSSIMMAGEIGNQNYKQVNRLFTMCLSSIVIINFVLIVVLYSCTNLISHLLTDEERLLSLLNAYLPISFIGCFMYSLQFAFAQFIQISGRPGLVTKCMIVAALSNIALDLLFVAVFDMGMQGAALASTMSFLFSILVFIPYLRSEPKPFKFVTLRGGWYGALFSKSLVRGLPDAVETTMISVLIIGLNAVVLDSQGANGIFILSVCMQVLMISMLVMEGIGDAIVGIGGVLLGEQDYEGLHLLVRKIFKITGVVMIAFSIILMAFPTLLAHLFGAEGELLSISEAPLRIFSFSFIPIGLVIPLSCLFTILNRNVMSITISVGMFVFVLSLVWITSLFAPEYLWYSIPFALWLLLLFTAVTNKIISLHTKGVHWFFLTQMHSNYRGVTYSVKYETGDVGRKLDELLDLTHRFKLPPKLHLAIEHCLEELMRNEVEMAHYTKKVGTFDISMNDQEDKIYIIIKDAGKPYNPITKYIPNTIDDVDESKLSMLLVNSLCKNLTYKYMNGVNCLYLNFEKNKYNP